MQRLRKACCLCRRRSDCWWRLLLENSEETSLYKKEIILWSKVHYLTIWGSSPQNKFCYQLSKWKYYIRKENLPLNSCDLKLLDYAIWNMVKKVFHKNAKGYEDIESLSAPISDAWETDKKVINNSTEQWRMRLEKVVKGCGYIEHLTWRHWSMILSTYP